MKNIMLFLFISSFFACANQEVFKDSTCIQNISTIDPIDGLKENQTVIIKDNKISKIVNSDAITLSAGNKIVDGSGKYLIPGLWDAHIHFAYEEELAPSMLDLFLSFGITSVRDTGGEIGFVNKWKKKAQEQPQDAPRVMIAGPLLDGLPNVYDGSAPSRPPLSVGLGTMENVEKQIKLLDSLDVDLLKAYEMLTPEQFTFIAGFAKSNGLPLTGHVPLLMDVIQASNAGLNSMEHLRNLELSCASNSDELLQQRIKLMEDGKNDLGGILRSRIHSAQRKVAIENYDQDRATKVLDVLLKNDTWQIPTLALNNSVTQRPFAKKEWTDTYEYMPDQIAKRWLENGANALERDVSDFQKTYTKWQLNMVGQMNKKGIQIMAGTDCPIYFLVPGRSLHEELVMLSKSGLSPLEILKTATYNPAKYFNMQDRLGKIDEGFIADLLILDANPLDKIENTMTINTVIKDGKFHNRTDLDRRLEKLKTNF